MNMILFVAVISIAVAVFIYKVVQLSREKNGPEYSFESAENETGDKKSAEEIWWSSLKLPAQLDLALALARKALPVWQQYSDANDVRYKNSSIGPAINLDPSLLSRSLEEISRQSHLYFPENNAALVHCRNKFVAPLVALQDGNWELSYAVKRIFLSVYNILKAIEEQQHVSVTKNFLSLSIHQSLDCLDMSRLYDSDEIRTFLQSYKMQVG